MIASARQLITLCAVPGLRIPSKGWNRASFKAQAAALAKSIHRVRIISTSKVGSRIAKTVRANITDATDEIAARVLAQTRKKAVTTGLDISSLWNQAIEKVLAETEAELRRKLLPDLQSIVGQGYSRTSLLLGGDGKVDSKRVLARAQKLTEQTAQMSQTTATRVAKQVDAGHEQELTDEEIAEGLTDALEKHTNARADVAGKAMSTAGWSDGSTEAMRDEGATHVSVIGCISRERSQWGKEYYRDYMWPPVGSEGDGREPESACNIQDVPIQFASELNFHPNHTGTIVPSGFDE